MSSRVDFIGCPCDFNNLLAINDRLNEKVVERLNESQELLMLNSFAQESNEYQLKKCFEERIADVTSWRWVFQDLSKRLDAAVDSFDHEQNALKVIVKRIETEISDCSVESSRPGALTPLTDSVEDTIMKEHKFLKGQKKKFEGLLEELAKQTKFIKKINRRIQTDITGKDNAISIEEEIKEYDLNSVTVSGVKKRKKKACSVNCWENRCLMLKRTGLKALASSIVTRQQIRGARIQLSIDAQSHAARVDAVLKRRLHVNQSKLAELKWQKDEAINDMQSLDEELNSTEQNLVENLDKARVIELKLSDRKKKPRKELTKDHVDMSLRSELTRLRQFANEMRDNLKRIESLKHTLTDAISRNDDASEDLRMVVQLDKERVARRLGEGTEIPPSEHINSEVNVKSHNEERKPLHTIAEESEDEYNASDDYPFDF